LKVYGAGPASFGTGLVGHETGAEGSTGVKAFGTGPAIVRTGLVVLGLDLQVLELVISSWDWKGRYWFKSFGTGPIIIRIGKVGLGT
jgi:hypothetical protein